LEIGSSAWRQLLTQGAHQFNIQLTGNQLDQLTTHVKELLAWNRITNLTAITKPREVAIKHIIDSMALVNVLSDDITVLDIGSGGGFPGLVLKILTPQLNITLIDGVRKKISFLQHVIRKLGLKEAEALHIRAEELAKETDYKGAFDFVTYRAVGQISDLIELALPFLKPNGSLLFLKGPQAMTELEQSSQVSDRFQIDQHFYLLPDSIQERVVIKLTRAKE
jgi:16S rRNA (guanine527-N7)-methyltransferase